MVNEQRMFVCLSARVSELLWGLSAVLVADFVNVLPCDPLTAELPILLIELEQYIVRDILVRYIVHVGGE